MCRPWYRPRNRRNIVNAAEGFVMNELEQAAEHKRSRTRSGTPAAYTAVYACSAAPRARTVSNKTVPANYTHSNTDAIRFYQRVQAQTPCGTCKLYALQHQSYPVLPTSPGTDVRRRRQGRRRSVARLLGNDPGDGDAPASHARTHARTRTHTHTETHAHVRTHCPARHCIASHPFESPAAAAASPSPPPPPSSSAIFTVRPSVCPSGRRARCRVRRAIRGRHRAWSSPRTLRIPDGQKRWETLQPIGEGRY